MSKQIIIDMPEFKKYIKNMEELVSRIIQYNHIFSRHILEADETGWNDDVYSDTRNQLLSLQETTNVFINGLETIDSELIIWYRGIYENYYRKEYSPIQLQMDRVELIPDKMMKNDERMQVAPETMALFIEHTEAYVNQIREELSNFDGEHIRFSEYFQTSKYDELSISLKAPIARMEELLANIEFLKNIALERLIEVLKNQ